LDALYDYANVWGLNVSVNKSKVIVFRNCNTVITPDRWHVGGELLEVVDKFSYLGFLFDYNNMAEKQLSDQVRKAMFALYGNTRDMFLNPETYLSLFDLIVT
jgi:hypothetical protein